MNKLIILDYESGTTYIIDNFVLDIESIEDWIVSNYKLTTYNWMLSNEIITI